MYSEDEGLGRRLVFRRRDRRPAIPKLKGPLAYLWARQKGVPLPLPVRKKQFRPAPKIIPTPSIPQVMPIPSVQRPQIAVPSVPAPVVKPVAFRETRPRKKKEKGLPKWIVPAAIGGVGLLLVIVLMMGRSPSPAKGK